MTDWSTIASLATAGIFKAVTDAFTAGEPPVINLHYGDFEGGQRVVTQITLRHANERWLAQATRHFSVDRPDPPLAGRSVHSVANRTGAPGADVLPPRGAEPVL